MMVAEIRPFDPIARGLKQKMVSNRKTVTNAIRPFDPIARGLKRDNEQNEKSDHGVIRPFDPIARGLKLTRIGVVASRVSIYQTI